MIVIDYIKCISSELYLVSYLLQLPGVEFDLFVRGLGFRAIRGRIHCAPDYFLLQMFVGNSNSQDTETRVLKYPVMGRHVRFHPQRWVEIISLRVEIYGCPYSKQSSGSNTIQVLVNQSVLAISVAYIYRVHSFQSTKEPLETDHVKNYVMIFMNALFDSSYWIKVQFSWLSG